MSGERKPPGRAFPPPPPEYRIHTPPRRPPVAICIYDPVARSETWVSMEGPIRWVNQGAEHVAVIGHDVGGRKVAITMDVSAIVAAFERTKARSTG